jgi:hypothetical protein
MFIVVNSKISDVVSHLQLCLRGIIAREIQAFSLAAPNYLCQRLANRIVG